MNNQQQTPIQTLPIHLLHSITSNPSIETDKMSVEGVKDRKGEDINEGDHVWTRYRGGVREGDVHTYSPFFQNHNSLSRAYG